MGAFLFQLPRHVHCMLKDVPEEDRPENEAEFWSAVAIELGQLVEYAAQAKSPELIMRDVEKAGNQYHWNFWVNDLDKPKENSYNWHGQNTSQWLYAGSIMVCDRQVSRHH